MANVQKRLYVGGLTSRVDADEISERFSRYGAVSDLRVRTKKDEEGNTVNVFAHLNISGTEDKIKKCFNTYQNTKWKGSVLKIQYAKESFLTRLETERENVHTSTNSQDEKPVQAGEWKPPDIAKPSGPAVPGTPIPGNKDWIVGKYGRVLPILTVKKSYKLNAIKHDPSKFCHAAKVFKDENQSGSSLSCDKLTWVIDKPDSEITKKRKGQFPASPKTVKKNKGLPAVSADSHMKRPSLHPNPQLSTGFETARLGAAKIHSRPKEHVLHNQFDSDIGSDFECEPQVSKTKDCHVKGESSKFAVKINSRGETFGIPAFRGLSMLGMSTDAEDESFFHTSKKFKTEATPNAVTQNHHMGQDDMAKSDGNLSASLADGSESSSSTDGNELASSARIIETADSSESTSSSDDSESVSSADGKKSAPSTNIIETADISELASSSDSSESTSSSDDSESASSADGKKSVPSTNIIETADINELASSSDSSEYTSSSDRNDLVASANIIETNDSNESASSSDGSESASSADGNESADTDIRGSSTEVKRQINNTTRSGKLISDQGNFRNEAVLNSVPGKNDPEAINGGRDSQRVVDNLPKNSQRADKVTDMAQNKTKHTRDNEKRLKALDDKKQLHEKQKQIMAQALKVKSPSVTSRIVFDSDDEEYEGKATAGNTRNLLLEKQAPTKKLTLLETSSDSDDEDSDYDEMFKSKPQFEGKKGGKLLALERKFADSRFKLDARFAESDSSEEDEAQTGPNHTRGAHADDEDETERAAINEEKKKSLQVLETIVGKNKLDKLDLKMKKSAKFMIDITSVRFDPTKMAAQPKSRDTVADANAVWKEMKERNMGDNQEFSKTSKRETETHLRETKEDTTTTTTTKSNVTLTSSLIEMFQKEQQQNKNQAEHKASQGFSLLDQFGTNEEDMEVEDSSDGIGIDHDASDRIVATDSGITKKRKTSAEKEKNRKDEDSKNSRKHFFSHDEMFIEHSHDDPGQEEDEGSDLEERIGIPFNPDEDKEKSLQDAGRVDIRYSKEEWSKRWEDLRPLLLKAYRRKRKTAQKVQKSQGEFKKTRQRVPSKLKKGGWSWVKKF